MFNIKQFSLVIISLIILSGCNTINLSNRQYVDSQATDEIYVVTDIHYLSNQLNDHGPAFDKLVSNLDGRQINYIEELTDAFVSEVIETKPQLLIISGDLTHNGAKVSHQDLAEKLAKIEQAGTMVLVTPGNHDINNPHARELKGDEFIEVESVTANQFQKIYQQFGFAEAISQDQDSLSYIVAPRDDLWVLMLDTNIYANNSASPSTNGRLSEETLEWINQVTALAAENNAEVLTVMHHNIFKHSNLLHHGYVINQPDTVINTFQSNNQNLVLSGHIHIQSIVANQHQDLTDIVTSGFVIYPTQYGVLKFDSGVYDYQTRKVDVSNWAKQNNSSNPDLLNYDDYSYDYFYQDTYYKVVNSLTDSSSYTSEQIEIMADTAATLNAHYFGGTINGVRMQIITSEGYQLWEDHQDDFLREYVIDIATEKQEDPSNHIIQT